MGSLLLVPGLDTRLARLLLERRRVEYPTLHAALTKVRALRQTTPHTLAQELVELGLVEASDLEATIAEFLGDSPDQPQRWRVGDRVAGLELLGSLGSGGMGEVLLARDLETGSQVAVKTLRIDEDEDLLARFQREAEAQARVDTHPNVVRIHRSGVARGRAFLVMDAVCGGDLARRLQAGPLEPRAAAALVRDLARGLAYAHERGVLHRDLKPANVLFDERGVPRLADFGLARLLEADALTRTGEILGTPSFMAPEQATSQAQDERTDVYGLGGILYAALTSAPPFEGGTVYALLERVITAPAPDPRERVPEIPAELAELCQRCLEKSPEDRFASAAEVGAKLESFLEGELEPARRGAGLLLGSALLGVVLLGLAAAGALAWSEPARESPTASAPRLEPSLALEPEQIRAEVEWAGPGLAGALLAERYLERGLGPERWLRDRAAEPFLEARVEEVSAVIPLGEKQLFAWRGAKDFDGPPLAYLLDAETGEVARTWTERVLAFSPSRARIAFWSREGFVRLVETETWSELGRAPVARVFGASFRGEEELWLVGPQGLSLLPLAPIGPPVVVWTPPSGEDASMVQPLPSGDVLVASGRSHRTVTRLRCLSPRGQPLWQSFRTGEFDGKPRILEVSPSGRHVIFGTASGQITLFETAASPQGDREPKVRFKRPLTGEESPMAKAARRAHLRSVVSMTWLSEDLFVSVEA